MRALPCGTVGKPSAMANTPSSNSSRLNCWASGASPSMTGVMGVVLRPVLKPSFFISSLKYLAFSHRRVHQFGRTFQQVERGQAGGRVRGGDGGGEQEGAAALAQPFHDDRIPGHHPAHHAEGFGKRSDLHIHFAVQAEMVHDAAPALAEHAFAMGIIHHQQDVVHPGDFVDLVQRGHITVHAEDPVGDDDGAPVVATGFP